MESDHDIIEAACRPAPFIEDDAWAGLTEAQRQFISILYIAGQVFNGGFHAVYYNNCAPYLPMALLGLERIGAEGEASIVREVIRLMDKDPWAGPPETWPDPDRVEPPVGSGDIGDYDDKWYLLDATVRCRKMAEYITSNPSHFAPIDS